MPSLWIDLALYGDIAPLGGGTHVAQMKVELPGDCVVGDLLDKLGLADGDKGYVFINAVLADAPGLNACRLEPLHDGDHVGVFSSKHMWPYQYRDGVRMTERLQAEMRVHGAMHHTYTNT